MSVPEQVYNVIDRTVLDFVSQVIGTFGVPSGIDEAHALAEALHPHIVEYRNALFAQEVEQLQSTVPGIVPPSIRPYPLTAVQKSVRVCAGLTPDSRPMLVEVFDEETQRVARRPVAPWTMPDDEEVLREMQRRLVSSSTRHVKQSGRDAVIDAAGENGLAWARRLSGIENCGFCAMLASRGAAYTKKGVRFSAHDGCDCQAVLVENPNDWDGMDMADELEELWSSSTGLSEFTKRYREEYGFVGMAP